MKLFWLCVVCILLVMFLLPHLRTLRHLLVGAILAAIAYFASPYVFPETVVRFDPSSRPSSADESYRETIFDYAMSTANPQVPYVWESYSAKGKITASESYVSKSKATCRDYEETYITGVGKIVLEGIGCKRTGREGWCRLKKNSNALTCSLEAPSGVIDETIGGAQDVLEKAKGVTR